MERNMNRSLVVLAFAVLIIAASRVALVRPAVADSAVQAAPFGSSEWWQDMDRQGRGGQGRGGWRHAPSAVERLAWCPGHASRHLGVDAGELRRAKDRKPLDDAYGAAGGAIGLADSGRRGILMVDRDRASARSATSERGALITRLQSLSGLSLLATQVVPPLTGEIFALRRQRRRRDRMMDAPQVHWGCGRWSSWARTQIDSRSEAAKLTRSWPAATISWASLSSGLYNTRAFRWARRRCARCSVTPCKRERRRLNGASQDNRPDRIGIRTLIGGRRRVSCRFRCTGRGRVWPWTRRPSPLGLLWRNS